MNESQLTSEASNQLDTVDIRPYNSFLSDLYEIANESDISTIWISSAASQAIYSRIPSQKRLIAGNFYSFTSKDINRKFFSFTS